MEVVINKIPRVFKFKDEKLTDPDPSMTVTEVIEHYSAKYPEMTVATQKAPQEKDGELVYELEYSVGNKG